MFVEAGSNETNGKRLVIMVTMTDVNLTEGWGIQEIIIIEEILVDIFEYKCMWDVYAKCVEKIRFSIKIIYSKSIQHGKNFSGIK